MPGLSALNSVSFTRHRGGHSTRDRRILVTDDRETGRSATSRVLPAVFPAFPQTFRIQFPAGPRSPPREKNPLRV